MAEEIKWVVDRWYYSQVLQDVEVMVAPRLSWCIHSPTVSVLYSNQFLFPFLLLQVDDAVQVDELGNGELMLYFQRWCTNVPWG